VESWKGDRALRFVAHLVVGIALLASSDVAASGFEVVVSTGRERGSYYFIGRRLDTEFAVRHNQVVDVRTSHGSLDNLGQLHDPESPVNVALTQADALQLYLDGHPDFAGEFFVLGELGRECVFLVAGKDGPKSIADLKRGSGEVSVDDAGSGAAVTWRNMTALEPAFAATTPVFVPTMEAILQLKVGGPYTRLRAAMLVQRPRRASPPIEAVLDAPDGYRLVPITEADVPNAKMSDGSDVYSFERVIVGGKKRGNNLGIDTLCTRGLMLGSKAKLSAELRSQLSTLMLEAGDRVVRADE
jgi:hypothetical protein